MSITEIANDYINDMASNSELDRAEFLAEQCEFYSRNADHLSDCFTDTATWAEGEEFTKYELEAEIVRLVKDENNR